MKVQHVSRSTFKRSNPLKMAILKFFWHICSYPRIIIEVFLRVDFGERYYSLFRCIVMSLALLIYPFLSPYSHAQNAWEVFFHNPIWFAFTGAFIYFAYLRRKEIKRNPRTIDFEAFSLCLGYPHPKIEALLLRTFGDLPPHDVHEKLLEPLTAFIVGLVLLLVAQALGVVLMLCAICYSVSYMAAYEFEREEMLDLIDNTIRTQQRKAIFIEGRSPRETKGVRHLGERPTREDAKAKLSAIMWGGDEAAEVI